MKSELTHRRLGRPRCPDTRSRILESAIDELAFSGWDHFTIESVAARSKVSKVTIYRWWQSKAHLILDAYIEFGVSPADAEVTGNLEVDLRAILAICVDVFSGHKSAAARAVVAAMQSDVAMAAKFQEFWCPASEFAVKRAFDASGHPEPDDLHIFRDILIGPICLRCLITGEAPDDDYIDSLISVVLGTIRAPSIT